MPSLTGCDLVVATGNSGKLAEFRALLGPRGVQIISLADLGLDEPEETEVDFRGNALLKARAAAKASGKPALADDSGLCVRGLGGAPGVFTADWAETGTGRDFKMAMQKTWGLVQAVSKNASKVAEFRCALAVVWPDGLESVFEGSLAGELVWPSRGAEGHGFDPIFQPVGHSITMGEMDQALKNSISHRADAVSKLLKGCFT
jgi:XTP/dITP diphosphohydrolase